jgi:hypothetical protein
VLLNIPRIHYSEECKVLPLRLPQSGSLEIGKYFNQFFCVNKLIRL